MLADGRRCGVGVPGECHCSQILMGLSVTAAAVVKTIYIKLITNEKDRTCQY